jgi:ribosomal protein S18 acetylase RimI-like enzyme
LNSLEIIRLTPAWIDPLHELFKEFVATGVSDQFHPHQLTYEEAVKRSTFAGSDLYYICIDGETLLGYGMLRGWDEGYEIPSLGLALSSAARGSKLGESFMYFLQAAARRRGATKIRLKVYKSNLRAKGLYERLGYKFVAEEGMQLVGFLDL